MRTLSYSLELLQKLHSPEAWAPLVDGFEACWTAAYFARSLSLTEEGALRFPTDARIPQGLQGILLGTIQVTKDQLETRLAALVMMELIEHDPRTQTVRFLDSFQQLVATFILPD